MCKKMQVREFLKLFLKIRIVLVLFIYLKVFIMHPYFFAEWPYHNLFQIEYIIFLPYVVSFT